MNNLDSKTTDQKKAEEMRRAEITMMYLYIEKYPDLARGKVRKINLNAADRTGETPKTN